MDAPVRRCERLALDGFRRGRGRPKKYWGEAMEVYFEEDILTNILSRLPVRSLLRFKCVAKFWKTLVDDPYFRMKHLNHTKNDKNFQKFLFYQLSPMKDIFSIHSCSLSSAQVEDVRKLDFPSNVEPRCCQVYCCCDGLAIIRVDESNDESHILLLWNPSTEESIVLPTPEFSVEGYCCLGMSFDSNSDDYKILKIPQYGNERRNVYGEILALKSGSWRKIDEHPGVIFNMLYVMHSLACIHGAFHWVGFSRNYFVVSLNISYEEYGEIPLPDGICLRDSTDIGISELEGMLCAYSNAYLHGNHPFKLWVMKDYGLKESWIALFSIANPYISMPMPKYRFADGTVLFWYINFRRMTNAYGTQRGPFRLLPPGLAQNGFAFTESLICPKLLM
ncbi:hypothetical protein BC332_32965 [Capsicum chinense]|nr:hypothetical protein BC332_32965 [Capsicum chinense]